MRTVLVATQTYAAIGGAQSWLDQMADALPAHGWRLVVALAWGRRFHDAAAFSTAHPGLETVLLDGRSGTRIGRLLAIERAIHSVRPHVVVPMALVDPLQVVAELKAGGSDVRLLFGSYEVSPTMLCDVRRYRAIIDRGLGISRITTALLTAVGGLSPERVDYVPSGVQRARRLASGLKPGPLRLAYLGRFDPDKRPLDLLSLREQLEGRDLDFDLVAIGGGALEAALRLGVERSPAARRRLRISAPLPRDELYDRVYPELDACLLFSPAEGLGYVLLEAMMHGVVPVCSDYVGRGAQGLVVHGRTGLVFPVGDMARATDEIVRLAREPGLHPRLAAQARAHVEAEYDLERMATGWSRSLERALEGPPAHGHVAPPTDTERDTLGRLLGRRWGELARRMLRRPFIHADASEWPHCGTAAPQERTLVELEVAAVARRFDEGGASSTIRLRCCAATDSRVASKGDSRAGPEA